jgi:pimeloyl-ACP methyl ester carboxylesterase
MRLAHGRVGVELHELSAGQGDADRDAPPLLLLHELGASAAAWPDLGGVWPGAIHALDFAGHGKSDPLRGGGYYPEHFLADADLALAALDERAVVAGAGVGAFVALLLAGARPTRVPAALLLQGRGLIGGGGAPTFAATEIVGLDEQHALWKRDAKLYEPGTDWQVARCEHFIRPADYVAEFARAASRLCLHVDADDQAGKADWWRRMRAEAETGELVSGTLPETLATLHASVA